MNLNLNSDGLALLSTSAQKSESAMSYDVVGVCPKCGVPMGTSRIENGDSVHFCAGCRVSGLMPNDSQGA